LRLTETGRKLGLVDDARWSAFGAKRDAIDRETARLKATWAHPSRIPVQKQIDATGQPMERESTLFDLLRRPNVTYDRLRPLMEAGEPLPPDVEEQVETSAKYAGYIERQREEIGRHAAQEGRRIPEDMDYVAVRGLSKEVQQKLAQHRPETIGQAARVQGVTPAAIALLLVHLKRREARGESRESA
jgi:NAD/FAD-utilizing enzyme apparently involved in cell division